jgi:hypothetical protein
VLSTPYLGEDTEAREASARINGGVRRLSVSLGGRRLSGPGGFSLQKPSHNHQHVGGGGGGGRFVDGTGSRTVTWGSEWGAAIEGLTRVRSRPDSRDVACQAALLKEDHDSDERGQISAATAAGTQNDTGEGAGVWLESELVAAEKESARARERERETEETEMHSLYSQMDAIQSKLDWVTRERLVDATARGGASARGIRNSGGTDSD